MGYMFGGMWLWMVFGFILFVLFWGGIIWLIAWAVKKGTGHLSACTSDLQPLSIAQSRYAKGEITKEQFEQIKRDLS